MTTHLLDHDFINYAPKPTELDFQLLSAFEQSGLGDVHSWSTSNSTEAGNTNTSKASEIWSSYQGALK